MTVTNVSSTGSNSTIGAVAAAATTKSNMLGANDFMQLLLAQLTHQDPLSPMSDSDMMTQFSQLNSLQSLQTMATTMGEVESSSQIGYAASLVGKQVKVARSDGTTAEGIVTGVQIQDKQANLQIGNESLPVTSLLEIEGG
ncbi:MAG: flagellar hook capping FlgD N-terminal domain-containing protein [Anaerolineaceae bacterium]|nr:flagellar hook capping FlgD N-terminal domain-containing protein [Anaerolineaceae bacterium]